MPTDTATATVVVDAPPTGRVVPFLNVTVAMAGLAKRGPIRNQAEGVVKLLHSAEACVHLVTLLEDMPVTETIEVEVTPAVCLDAINSARAGFNVAADLMDVLGPAVEAAFYQDIAGLEAAMDDLEVLNAELNQNMFATEAAACEGAAR